jgi:hypothetical protein
MDLTPELKAEIDARTYYSLLQQWRFAPSGTPMFEGESGEYFGKRMSELKALDPGGAVAASKALG